MLLEMDLRLKGSGGDMLKYRDPRVKISITHVLLCSKKHIIFFINPKKALKLSLLYLRLHLIFTMLPLLKEEKWDEESHLVSYCTPRQT